eukprot:897959_1
MNCFCIIHSRSTSHSESTSISESHTNKSIKLHNKLLSNSKYIITKHIAKTLQGEVCIAEYAKYKHNKCICLYMLSIGSSPFSKADISDIWYKCFVKGQMKQMLQQWNRLHYVERRQYDLMMRMICIDEKKRLCIEEIMNHVWIKSYF